MVGMLKGIDEAKATAQRIYQSIEAIPDSPYLSNDKGLDRPAPKTPHGRVIPLSAGTSEAEQTKIDCKTYQTSLAKTAKDLGGTLKMEDVPCPAE
jgi:hypothetical protein